MLVAGFTIVKNAVQYGYPIVQSINSILPVCDVFYVSVGDCTDGTREMIASIPSDKIVLLDSIWDKDLTQKGEVLASETNKVFQQIPSEYTWCFYLQADEAVHEQDHALIKQMMQRYEGDSRVQGLLFDYYHFWGSFNYTGSSSRWYRKEIRIIKNNKDIFSYRDAQGFRMQPNNKLEVIPIQAPIYHYGWVRPPLEMQAKFEGVQNYWQNENKKMVKRDTFDYSEIDLLDVFEGTHPAVMQATVDAQNWVFHFDKNKVRIPLKERFKLLLYRLSGRRFFEYKNYKIIR